MSVEEEVVVPVEVVKVKKVKKVKKDKKEKKAKATENGDAADAVDDSAVDVEKEVEQKTKDKKDKKEKKEKKEKKKAKKEAKAASANTPEESTTEESTAEEAQNGDTPVVAAEGEAEAKKEKKAKKDKKKKDKKDKKSKAEDTEMVDAPAEPATEPKDKKRKARDDDAPAPKPKKTKASPPGSYTQSDALTSLPQSEIDDFLTSKFVAITDPTSDSPLRPALSFDHLPSTPLLAKKPFAAFPAPTPIQSASWPFTLSGRDVIGVAETGSGKTMAFALPCVEALHAESLAGKKPRGTRAVVVCPTRELAMQTHEQVTKLTSLVNLTCVCIYGGAPKHEQRDTLRRGADIIVATPGRLKDFLSEGAADLSRSRFVVLDEADRMLDTGFEEDIKEIMRACPSGADRQTLMFTATWPTSVQALASSMMSTPVKITISSSGANPEGDLQANKRISQTVEVVEPRDKEFRLVKLLQSRQRGAQRDDRILVFCLYKKEATRVEESLSRKGIKVAGIHGDLKQEQRTRSLEAFKAGKVSVLVATDVAARGLDIPEVKLVINLTVSACFPFFETRLGAGDVVLTSHSSRLPSRTTSTASAVLAARARRARPSLSSRSTTSPTRESKPCPLSAHFLNVNAILTR